MTYLRHSFEVPRSWRVINLDRHRRTCVRFDRHTVYLGTPSPNQACPSLILGTTEAMLIEPASRHAAYVSAENKVTRQITVIAGRVHVTATFDAHPKEIHRILSSAGLPRPVKNPPNAQPAATVPSLPAGVTNYHGRGFDTCAAPSEAAMRAWWRDSPYRAVGIYLGGSDAACAQPNLTPSWLRDEAAQGWHFIPMYVGRQAAYGELSKSSAGQGAVAAADAVHQAKRLGFGHRTPIYYDMEAYRPGQTHRVLRFLSAWTTTLHALGYSSGVYSSSSSGIAALAHQYGRGRYAVPDVINDALWNGHANTQDPLLCPGEWTHHHRLHQYNGNLTQTHGGIKIHIDEDFLNVRLPRRPSPSPATIAYRPGAAATPVHRAGVRHLHSAVAGDNRGLGQAAVRCHGRVGWSRQSWMRQASADGELGHRIVKTEMAAAPDLCGLAAPVPHQEQADSGGQARRSRDQAICGGERGHGRSP